MRIVLTNTVAACMFAGIAGIIVSQADMIKPETSVQPLTVDIAAIRGNAYLEGLKAADEASKAAHKALEGTKQLNCLAKLIWSEGRGESRLGQQAIGQVVLNRVQKGTYGDSICKVVNYKRKGVYHFSANNPRDVNFRKVKIAFAKDKYSDTVVISIDVARKLIDAPSDVVPSNSYNYHSKKVRPKWRRNLVKYETIGSHIFYTDKAL